MQYTIYKPPCWEYMCHVQLINYRVPKKKDLTDKQKFSQNGREEAKSGEAHTMGVTFFFPKFVLTNLQMRKFPDDLTSKLIL